MACHQHYNETILNEMTLFEDLLYLENKLKTFMQKENYTRRKSEAIYT